MKITNVFVLVLIVISTSVLNGQIKQETQIKAT